MKLASVAQDRVDIAEAVKCLTRYMKEPRSGHMQVQTSEATLQVHVDSDWAGDLLGRKSTTGVTARRGKHLLRNMSCLQTLVALSSGEAEYYILIRGACTSLGIQSQYQDWMIGSKEDMPLLASRVALGYLKLDVVAGEQNPADSLTKPLPGRKMNVGQRLLQQS